MQRTMNELENDLGKMVLDIVDDLELNNCYPDIHLSNVKRLIQENCEFREKLFLDVYDKYVQLYSGNDGDYMNRNVFIHEFGSKDPRYFYDDEDLGTRAVKSVIGAIFGTAFGLLSILVSKNLIPIANRILATSVVFGGIVGFKQKEMKTYLGSLRYPECYNALCSYHDGLNDIRNSLLDKLACYTIDYSSRII